MRQGAVAEAGDYLLAQQGREDVYGVFAMTCCTVIGNVALLHSTTDEQELVEICTPKQG